MSFIGTNYCYGKRGDNNNNNDERTTTTTTKGMTKTGGGARNEGRRRGRGEEDDEETRVDRDGDTHTQRVWEKGQQRATRHRRQSREPPPLLLGVAGRGPMYEHPHPAVSPVCETAGSIILSYYLLPPSFAGGPLFYLVLPIQCAPL